MNAAYKTDSLAIDKACQINPTNTRSFIHLICDCQSKQLVYVILYVWYDIWYIYDMIWYDIYDMIWIKITIKVHWD